MDDILVEMKLQTALLQEMERNIAGLRADMRTTNKDAMEKAMKDTMDQVGEMFKNTPMAPIIANMMTRKSREGGRPDGK